MTTVAPDQVEAPQKGFIGTSIHAGRTAPRPGAGVFFDDVESATAWATSADRLAVRPRMGSSSTSPRGRAVEGVYGTLIGEEVAAQTDPFFEMSTPPGSEIRDYALAVFKVRRASRRPPSSPRRASWRATCRRAGRGGDHRAVLDAVAAVEPGAHPP